MYQTMHMIHIENTERKLDIASYTTVSQNANNPQYTATLTTLNIDYRIKIQLNCPYTAVLLCINTLSSISTK